MAVPAKKLQAENHVEDRIARIEATTEHMQSDIAEMKGDIRRLDGKIDAVNNSVNELRAELHTEVSRLERAMQEGFEASKVGRALDKVWALLAMGALLGVMARGFHWL